jgi:hypothetical protein
MIERCIELSKTVRTYGEFPFAALVCNEEDVLSEVINRVDRDARNSPRRANGGVQSSESAGSQRSERLRHLFERRAVRDVFVSYTRDADL